MSGKSVVTFPEKPAFPLMGCAKQHTKVRYMRRAKIVATIGPAIESPEKISEAIKAGLNVARLNMSHGDHAEHQARYNTIREESAKLGKDVAILADLQGPKIRLERFANGKEYLEPGADFTITSEDVEGTAEICGTTYKGLPGDVPCR